IRTVCPEDRAMAQVLQAVCPGCKNVLRVPAHRLPQRLRCKNCGTVVQVRRKPSSAPPPRPAAEPAPTPALSDLVPDAGAPIVRLSVSRDRFSGFRLGAFLVIVAVLAAAVAGAYRYWPAFSEPAGTGTRRPKEESVKSRTT